MMIAFRRFYLTVHRFVSHLVGSETLNGAYA